MTTAWWVVFALTLALIFILNLYGKEIQKVKELTKKNATLESNNILAKEIKRQSKRDRKMRGKINDDYVHLSKESQK